MKTFEQFLSETMSENKVHSIDPFEVFERMKISAIQAAERYEQEVKKIHKPPVISSICPRCKSTEDIRVNPKTYDCMECGNTWQTDL